MSWVHFALTPDEAERVASASEDVGLMAAIEAIEDRWDREWLVETDNAWDAIHRCLTGVGLEYGPTPLHNCVLGEANRHDGDDYIVNLLGPDEVREVAGAIRGIDEHALRRSYFAIDPGEYGMPLSEEDFDYTWSNFLDLREFYQKASSDDRAVGFTVDQ